MKRSCRPCTSLISMQMPSMASTSARSEIFEDLSGVTAGAFDNPYDALILASKNNPVDIQARYDLHRTTRNSQQRTRLLDASFTGVSIDPILERLHYPHIEPGYKDPRHCLVLWARPSQKVRDLISRIQQELRKIAPSLWLMPVDCLHMTAMEVTHSRTPDEIQKLVDTMRPKVPELTDYTLSHRARLIKPLLGYDGSAVALSYLPAAGEGLSNGRTVEDDKYSYHHLRRDLYNLCQDAGVVVQSRYVVPSAHLTVARFVTVADFSKDNAAGEDAVPDPAKMKTWIEKIEEINDRLREEYWPSSDGSIKEGGEWICGEEKGLDNRMGSLWYGGGETVRLGTGF